MRVSPSKQIWCFGCNCMQSVCLHKGCPEHCDMCNRIKEIKLNRSTSPDVYTLILKIGDSSIL